MAPKRNVRETSTELQAVEVAAVEAVDAAASVEAAVGAVETDIPAPKENEEEQDAEDEDEEDEEEDEDDEDSEEEEDDEDEEEAEENTTAVAEETGEEEPKAKVARKSVAAPAKAEKAKAKAKGKAKAKKAESASECEASASENDDEPQESTALVPESAGAPVVPVPAPVDSAVAPVDDGKPKGRLMIQQIVLENFKSYGYRKVIGPFHKSFSSIVGPNGSGKSNTIDALLFVFGKRAKKMRLNKVSELIHSSGGLLAPPSAKVSVTFQDIIDTGDGETDYEVVEGSLLTVSREAFRNNSSKYYVDGKTSNFTEVNILLRKRGVDLEHNRFLILQGEVEQIALMKPKAATPHDEGLLEYLEDIIGSNRLIEKIEEMEGQVEKLSEQRTEKLNRLRMAEREKQNLDGPRREAEAWVKGEAERLELQSLVAQSEARRCSANLKGMEEAHKVLQSHMEEHRKRMEGFEGQVKAIEADHNTHLKEYNSIKAAMEKSAADFKEFEALDVKYTEDIAFQEQKLQKLQVTAEKEAESAKQLLADAEKLREEAPLREKELASAERFREQQARKLEEVYESLKGKAEELRPYKEAKEAELVPLQKRLTDVRKVVEVAQTEANLLKEKTSKIAEEKEEMKRQHEQCSERLRAREQEGADAAGLKNERMALVADAKERITAVSQQMEQVTQDVSTTRSKAEEAKNEFEQEHFRGKLIRSVYEASKAGKLRGVHGRLGDLGTIPKKYDVAVSTACGMLDAIVMDCTEDAQKVVEFIRREELGRTTCICLDKIKSAEREMEQVVQTPEGVPRLVDLIKPAKPEYAIAFYFALRNTIVAKDLDQATRIGMQGKTRWRVVTLQGQLVDTSGTMSGGGGQVAKGGMRASLCMHTQEEVKAMVEAYEQANARLQSIRQERRALEEALTLTEKEIGEYEVLERKCSMEAGSLKKQVEAYDARLQALKVPTLSGGDKTKLKELEKLIGSRSGELNDISEKHRVVEEEVRELHNQIMNIGGEKLKDAKQKAEDATKQCEDLRRLCKKSLLDAENMVKNSAKAEANAKAAKKDLGVAEKALAVLKEEHAKLDDKAESVLNSYNQLKETLAEKDAVLVELRQKRDAVIQEASTMKSQEVDLVNEMEEKTRTLRELYAKIAAWAAKLTEARNEYKQLPLDLLGELRSMKSDEDQEEGPEVDDECQELARKAISADLEAADLEKVQRAVCDARMLALEATVKNLKPNLASIEEFRRADAEHKLKQIDYDTVNNAREEARNQLEQMRQTRLEEFMSGFGVISMKLKEMYQMITLGGDAELELVDTLDPFSEGINFSVRPPKKSWKQITNLSGGEKTLASLSLVFALHHYRPTPLYFMDEIDAALDFRNVSIIANYIKERTKNAQFIVISLRNHMFELADLLVGIYKTEDVSKAVAINPSYFDVPVSALTEVGAKRPAPAPIQEGPPATKQRI